jgi:CMP-N-acetylneuraminic acid synthetase
MKKSNILAVILARGGSKRIPKKNISKISGHSLISYSIEASKNSKLIAKTIVSTDSIHR